MKKILALALALILVFSLTACSSSSGEQPSSVAEGSSEAGDSSTPEESGEEEIVIKMANNVELNKNSYDGLLIKALEEKTDFFERYPNVTFETYFVADQADYNQKLITMALSGSDEFDAVWISAADVGVLANGGVLMNLDEYYANETRFDIQDNDAWIVDAVNSFMWYNDSAYSFPYQTDCRIAFYYKPICEEVGYTAENYPKTIDEFVKFCQDVSAAGYNPWGIRNGEDWTIVYEWALPYYGSGGTFERFDEETQQWVANLDNDAGRKWISDVRVLCDTIPGDYITSMDWDVLQSVAMNGEIACHWIGTWMWADCLQRDQEEWAKYDTALIPSGTEYSGSSMGGWQLGIGKNTSKERADIIWEAIAAIATNPEANALATSAAMPFMRDAYDYSEWAQYEETKEGWANFEKQLETAQPICTPPCEAAANIYASMWTVWQEVTLDDTYSVEEGTKMLNDSIQSALDAFYGY